MRFISADAVHAALEYGDFVQRLGVAHTDGEPVTDRLGLEESEVGNTFTAIGAWQFGEGVGVKLVTSFPGNREKWSVPTVHALYAWFSALDGSPVAILDGQALVLRKTAATSALGAAMLAREDASSMVMVGAGAMAPHLVAAHRAVRPGIRRVGVWNRTVRRAEELVDSLGATGLDAYVARDLDEAVAGADIVSCATMAAEPLLHGRFLRPGTHVDLVGSFNPRMREADDMVVQRSRLFVDSYAAVGRAGDLVQPLKSGAIAPAHVLGDLFMLCRGEVSGRMTPEDITVLKNGGAHHLDYFTAREVMRSSESVE